VIICARPLLAPENDRICEKVVAPTMMNRIIPEMPAVPRRLDQFLPSGPVKHRQHEGGKRPARRIR
jgi:hypothetical protein